MLGFIDHAAIAAKCVLASDVVSGDEKRKLGERTMVTIAVIAARVIRIPVIVGGGRLWYTYIHTYIQTDRHTDIHTQTHTHTHTHTHKYTMPRFFSIHPQHVYR
ncbi:hypothetical protein E2C01_100979 [Portunus trituberculatus]|uniref:Uncharacterized protein n=1 Tax=Portunus trituberculatus TaxID=210409 RepID=A0A5B7KEZ1_PORTR|nr:hypothetical protein [Portunus trituberculatus]